MVTHLIYDKRKRAEDRFEYRSPTCSWDCWAWGTIIGIGGGLVAIVADTPPANNP